jgi:sulfotransferase
MKIAFLAGLPRSGSTLLASLLSQHPKIKVSEASTLLPLINTVREFWSTAPRHNAVSKRDRLVPVLNSITKSYHSEFDGVVVDKHREWPFYLDVADKIFGYSPKTIITVRNPLECAASFERLKQKEPEVYSQVEKHTYSTRSTTYDRANSMFAPDGSIGLAYSAIYEASIVQGRHKDMLFVDYDKLCLQPKNEMNRVFNYLNLDSHQISTENLDNAEEQNDEFYGLYKLHEIQKSVRNTNKDLDRLQIFADRFQIEEFWKEWT